MAVPGCSKHLLQLFLLFGWNQERIHRFHRREMHGTREIFEVLQGFLPTSFLYSFLYPFLQLFFAGFVFVVPKSDHIAYLLVIV